MPVAGYSLDVRFFLSSIFSDERFDDVNDIERIW